MCINETEIIKALSCKEGARAVFIGSERYSCIKGFVKFYEINNGALVYVKLCGLPQKHDKCQGEFFALHLHEGKCCSREDDFSSALAHYNPRLCAHPYHAGDMPPVLSCEGNAVSIFVTNRFCIDEVVGRTVVLHAMADDFHTSPSGNSGERIACGVIKSCR